jgi:Uma2 family endonuclease
MTSFISQSQQTSRWVAGVGVGTSDGAPGRALENGKLFLTCSSVNVISPQLRPFHVGCGDRTTMATAHAPKPRSSSKAGAALKSKTPALLKSKAPAPTALAEVATIGDLLKRLGDIPAHRVRLHPTPGTATEKDLLQIVERGTGLCELVEGTLVEKTVGYEESEIALLIATYLNLFVLERKLGIVTGADGTIRLFPGLVRIPDVAFASWNCFPDRKRPKVPIPHIAPDLVVEVLSKSNSKAEINRKLGEYFQAGVRLAWVVDPKKRIVRVYTSADQSVVKQDQDSLDGGDVLPGFSLPLAQIFVTNEA